MARNNNKRNDYRNDNNSTGTNQTQDQDKPITGTKAGAVLGEVQVRAVDRSQKDILDWRTAIQSFENPYYPIQQQLYDMYTDILLDGHLAGIVRKRVDMVLNKVMHYERPAGKEGYERVYDMDGVINTSMFRDMLREIILTQMWGRSGLEFVPGRDFCFKCIPRKHIKMKTQKITYEQFDLDTGVDYTDLWNIWVMGKSDDIGELASVAQYALLKRGDLADWSNYIEIFGQPQWVFKYDAWDTQTKAALKKVIDNLGSGLRIVIPKGADAEPQDAKTSNGNGELQEKFLKAMNDEMSVRLLGGTESTTSSKTSGYGQSKVHSDQQKEIIKSDMIYLMNMLNHPHFFRILKSYGLPVVEGGRFVFDKEADILFLSEKIKVDVAAIKAGLPVAQKYMYETYGIPQPEAGEPIMVPLDIMPDIYQEEEEEENGETPPADPKQPASKKQPKKQQQKKKPVTLGSLLRGIKGFFVYAPR